MSTVPPLVGQLKSWSSFAKYCANLADHQSIHGANAEAALVNYVKTGRLTYKNPTNGHVEDAGIPSRSNYLSGPLSVRGLTMLADGASALDAASMRRYLQTGVLYGEISCLIRFLIEAEFPVKFGRNLRTMFLDLPVGWIGLAAATGALDLMERWVPLLVEAMRRGYLRDGKYHGMLHFMLKLWSAARGREYPEGDYPRYEVAEGVLQLWDTPDVDVLEPWLVQLCNQHTRLTTSKDFMDFSNSFSHIPVEVLLLFRLRDQKGLANPVVNHPMMQFPWAHLWEVSEAKPDELLSQVYARLEQDEGITVSGLYRQFLGA